MRGSSASSMWPKAPSRHSATIDCGAKASPTPSPYRRSRRWHRTANRSSSTRERMTPSARRRPRHRKRSPDLPPVEPPDMRYVMKQKLLSWGDDFYIKDENERNAYFVDGKAFSIGDQL